MGKVESGGKGNKHEGLRRENTVRTWVCVDGGVSCFLSVAVLCPCIKMLLDEWRY